MWSLPPTPLQKACYSSAATGSLTLAALATGQLIEFYVCPPLPPLSSQALALTGAMISLFGQEHLILQRIYGVSFFLGVGAYFYQRAPTTYGALSSIATTTLSPLSGSLIGQIGRTRIDTTMKRLFQQSLAHASVFGAAAALTSLLVRILSNETTSPYFLVEATLFASAVAGLIGYYS